MKSKSLFLTALLSLGFNYSMIAATPTPQNTKPDNSVINERDRRPEEMTALNQSPARTDVELTRLIRQDLMRHSELSSNAHNIKVITVNGVVTLKGPVKNLQEMKIVDEIARGEAGVRNAINEMQTTSAE